VRKFRTPGSVRGAGGNSGSYRDRFGKVDRAVLLSASPITKHQRAGWVLTPSVGRMGRRRVRIRHGASEGEGRFLCDNKFGIITLPRV